MKIALEIQSVTTSMGLPDEALFSSWVEAALAGCPEEVEVVLRLVDEKESRKLNRMYRGKDRSTNVLSFPFVPPTAVESGLLGDLVICAPLVAREAREQDKVLQAHWAHMVVHGVLHLRGYEHQNDGEVSEMEQLERGILAKLGFPDPYET